MKRFAFNVLLVDDNAANLSFLTQFLHSQGCTVRTAVNGQQALDLFKERLPDIVLMDIMLPDMDGRAVTREIKALANQLWVPVIYMTALSSEADQVAGLEAGGDDYLVKPINLRILQARMKAMGRIAEMQHRLADMTIELSRYKARAEHETSIARELMARLIYEDRLQDDLLQLWQTPAETFSGDLIAATRATAERFYVIVADSTGHGLSAALPLLQLSQIFYTMAERGFSVSTIVQEMNNKTLARMPIDRFVSGVLTMIDPHNHLIEAWTGGNVPPVFIGDDGSVHHSFTVEHMPLGVAEPSEFSAFTQVYQWQTSGHLVVFTDGLVEAQNKDQEPFGEARLLAALTEAPPTRRLAAAQEAFRNFMGDEPIHDDVSMALIRCEN
jgi:CheY-like chemotaxis protein